MPSKEKPREEVPEMLAVTMQFRGKEEVAAFLRFKKLEALQNNSEALRSLAVKRLREVMAA